MIIMERLMQMTVMIILFKSNKEKRILQVKRTCIEYKTILKNNSVFKNL